jgi:hypothetical protein
MMIRTNHRIEQGKIGKAILFIRKVTPVFEAGFWTPSSILAE